MRHPRKTKPRALGVNRKCGYIGTTSNQETQPNNAFAAERKKPHPLKSSVGHQIDMKIDRAIGIIGLLISILGIVSIPKITAGWVALVVGLALICIYVFKTRQPDLFNLYACYIYDFTSGRNKVRARKVVLFKANRSGVIRLEATGLTGTGRYENFKSNLPGRLNIMKSDGGALKVQCDLEQPLSVGKEINWILSYDLVDSFDSEREEVCMSCLSEGRIGALHVLFSPEDPPSEFLKVISKNGIVQKSEDIKLNHEAPEVY